MLERDIVIAIKIYLASLGSDVFSGRNTAVPMEPMASRTWERRLENLIKLSAIMNSTVHYRILNYNVHLRSCQEEMSRYAHF